MVGVDTSINDVGTCAGTGRFIIGIRSASRLLVRETGQTPVSILLCGGDGDNGILFNEIDLCVRC